MLDAQCPMLNTSADTGPVSYLGRWPSSTEHFLSIAYVLTILHGLSIAHRALGLDPGMNAASIIDTPKPLVPDALYEAGQSVDFTTIYVPAASLVETCRALRETPSLRFNVLVEVTAADYLPREPRFEVVYHLLSIPNRLRLRVKVRVRSN
jgi:hypothetical protein